ncbi:hypothetical protein [Nonomuraea aurantiaca]|uniref:hypothetical protein n=1 Tax=Nonomuraea aurantiaca TaxID=2878562 RepID=UPI001CD9DC92|nr:hypothetical protein [Nonomuraea aurantiaca]MCA2226538.1 hypothetical protein [Nonomuraea aurantiaca]
MNPARYDPANLERLIRQELTNAGFTVEPPKSPRSNGPSGGPSGEGGLSLRREPGRGVVVSWEASPDLAKADMVKYETIRTAVQLALRTILAQAGFQVVGDFGGNEMLVIADPLGTTPEDHWPPGPVPERTRPSESAPGQN